MMNANKLIECLELQIELQELKKLGLTEEEIKGFIAFEWEPLIDKNIVTLLIESTPNDQH